VRDETNRLGFLMSRFFTHGRLLLSSTQERGDGRHALKPEGLLSPVGFFILGPKLQLTEITL